MRAFSKIVRLTLVGLLSVFYANMAFAWGQTGHRITGAIAEQYLTEKAKQSILGIIGNESLAEASTWADEMRSNPEAFWKRKAGVYHYVTVLPGTSYQTPATRKDGWAVEALKEFAQILKEPTATQKQKQLALRFTVHIIGDLHQPLHVGNGNDRGGNKYHVDWFGKPSNLHRVWDSQMIDQKQLSYTEWAAFLLRNIDAEAATKWMNADPFVWVAESAQIRDTIYPKERELSYQYGYDHVEILKTRLSQGGVRIAAYLNALFK